MDRGAWQATAHEVSELETTVIFIFSFCGFRGLPRGALVVKSPPANAGDIEMWV